MTFRLVTDCPDAELCLRIAETAARAAGDYIRPQFREPIAVDFKSRASDIVTEHDRRAEQIIRGMITEAVPSSVVVGEEYGGEGAGDLVWFVDPIDGTSNFAGGLPLYCVSIGVTWRGQPLAGVIYDPERDEMFVGSAAGLTLNGQPVNSRGHGSETDALCLTNLPHEGMDDAQGLAALGALLSRFRAVRRLGSSALALAYVAVGRADVCSELTTKPWDHAAGAALVLAGGGGFEARNSDGKPTDDIGATARYVAYGSGFQFDRSVFASILG
jgi:myo-inositol-1(or 4)-monophosphatase